MCDKPSCWAAHRHQHRSRDGAKRYSSPPWGAPNKRLGKAIDESETLPALASSMRKKEKKTSRRVVSRSRLLRARALRGAFPSSTERLLLSAERRLLSESRRRRALCEGHQSAGRLASRRSKRRFNYRHIGGLCEAYKARQPRLIKHMRAEGDPGRSTSPRPLLATLSEAHGLPVFMETDG